MEGVEQPLLDPVKFGELVEMVGPERTTALISAFDANVRADLSALYVAIWAGDLDQAGRLAHRSLGLCLVMETEALALQLRRIEEAAEAGDAEIAQGLATGIEPILMSALSEMRSALEPPASQGV